MPEFSFGGLINFLLGILSGFVLFSLAYVYFIVRGKSFGQGLVYKPSTDVKQEDLNQMIINKQALFSKRYKLRAESFGKLAFNLSYELVEEISRYYFPESKYPMLELNTNEIITLNHYITQRIDSILDQPILKNLRGVRITKIVRAYELKRSIDERKIVKAAKSKVVKKTMKYTLGAINIVNPAYWVRKLVINKSIDTITKKIGIMIIGVVGEETSKVYSKKLFDKDLEFDLVEQELKALEEETQNETT